MYSILSGALEECFVVSAEARDHWRQAEVFLIIIGLYPPKVIPSLSVSPDSFQFLKGAGCASTDTHNLCSSGNAPLDLF